MGIHYRVQADGHRDFLRSPQSFVSAVVLLFQDTVRSTLDQIAIVYSLNADDNTAVWISYDRKPDDWTRQFFGVNKPAPHLMPNYLAGFARPLISASTPALPLLPPVIENIEHKQEGGLPSAEAKTQIPAKSRDAVPEIS